MCLQYIVKCRYCGYWKHYSWDRCRENRLLLKKGCALGQPSQHPSQCEVFPENTRLRIRRQMTPYECPVQECKSTEIAQKLFEERTKIESARAAALAKARAEWEAKDKIKKAEFAAKYFRKLPVVPFSERRRSFLNPPDSDSATSSGSAAMKDPNASSAKANNSQQRPDGHAQTRTAEDQVNKGKEAASSIHSQVFEDSDDDFLSESSEEEVAAITKYTGAIDIKDSGRGRCRGRAIEFGDDGMPIRTVTP